MSFTTLENAPVDIDLVAAARDTGWSVDGTNATHILCNAGKMYAIAPITAVAGTTYHIAYNVLSISGGHVQFFIGTGAGQVITTPGFVDDVIVAGGADTRGYFYSDAACVITDFNLVQAGIPVTNKQQEYTGL